MEETLEMLWNEYFAEKCAVINTEAERELIKKADEMHKATNELLTKDQSESIEKYIEALYKIQSFSIKKAFFKGCEFTTSFFFEVRNYEKR